MAQSQLKQQLRLSFDSPNRCFGLFVLRYSGVTLLPESIAGFDIHPDLDKQRLDMGIADMISSVHRIRRV